MTPREEIIMITKELKGLFDGKAKLPASMIPDTIAEVLSHLRAAWSELQPWLPMSEAQKRKALSHPVSAQIRNLVTMEPTRTKFFTAAYLKAKFQALSADKRLVIPKAPRSGTEALDALICYYWKQETEGEHPYLKAFREELECDFQNYPPVKQLNEARELFRKLMTMRDIEAITMALENQFPDDTSLSAFAKAIKIKPVTQSRSKTALRKSPHERMAIAISQHGQIARMVLK
ncbi:MAG: hypothetical protein HY913_16570 [Desulfomonile tiedjei]|nr:hypothetical protein [Desulfomonile tiedjei]